MNLGSTRQNQYQDQYQYNSSQDSHTHSNLTMAKLHEIDRNESIRKKKKLLIIFFFIPMALLFVGIMAIGDGYEMMVYETMAVTPINDLKANEVQKIEGNIESTDEIVIWWNEERSISDPNDREYTLGHVDSFLVRDLSGSIKVDLSNNKDIKHGRHDQPFHDLVYCYEDLDTIGLVGKVSHDKSTISAWYIDTEAEKIGQRSTEFVYVGYGLVTIGTVLLLVYLFLTRKYTEVREIDCFGVILIGFLFYVLYVFSKKEGDGQYYGIMFLLISALVCLGIVFTLKFIKPKIFSKLSTGTSTSTTSSQPTPTCLVCGYNIGEYNKIVQCRNCGKILCDHCASTITGRTSTLEGKFCKTCYSEYLYKS